MTSARFPSADAAATTSTRGPQPRRLLGVWAHPDDEAYLSAGLMARTIDAGGDVTIVTATHGELGTSDPDLVGSHAFAAHRESELRSSLAELGVTDLRMLGIPDGGCASVDPARAIDRLLDVIDEVRPDAVVTFGPDGITGHSDHRHVSAWTTAAWAERREADLLYAAMTDRFVATYRELHDELGLFAEYGDGTPASVPVTQVALECALDDGELLRKRRALACHASQTAGLAEIMGEPIYLRWWQRETFRTPTGSEVGSARSTTRRVLATAGITS